MINYQLSDKLKEKLSTASANKDIFTALRKYVEIDSQILFVQQINVNKNDELSSIADCYVIYFTNKNLLYANLYLTKEQSKSFKVKKDRWYHIVVQDQIITNMYTMHIKKSCFSRNKH